MEIYPVLTDIPEQRFLLHYHLFSRCTSIVRKHSGLFKITLSALLSIVALLSWNSWKSNLYKNYEFDSQQLVRSLRNLKSDDLNLAAAYYVKGNHSNAIKIVSRHYRLQPSNIKLGLLYAQMLTLNGYLDTSKSVLNEVFLRADDEQKQETAFIMAVTLLKDGNYHDCKYWLEKISKTNLRYRQAQQLLSKISRLAVE